MIRFGVIGAGRNGSGHARYYHESPRSEVVAVADPDTERAEGLAAEVEARAISDYRGFLDQVDAVVISSPNFLHRDHAVACAEAGKHILCEKPMGLNAGEATEIADAVRQAGVASFIGFSVRFGQTVQTMQKLIEEGKIGRVISIWSRRMTHRVIRPDESWRSDQSLSGGLLFEINIHELDWLMALGGRVESVYARKYARGEEGPRVNDHIWFVLDLEGGAVATHEGSWVSPIPDYYRGVIGTKGGVAEADYGRKLLFAACGEKTSEIERVERFDKRAHFLDCIEKGAESLADAEWGRRVMTVADAILESAATGEVVQP
ncbi:MAG: Gfo/Idh/MocA family oxidoreductase [Candidatus Brocadiaceae bacterium]|jgi:predicted dehydrogenase